MTAAVAPSVSRTERTRNSYGSGHLQCYGFLFTPPPFTKRRKGLELHLGNDLLLGRGKGTRLVGRHLALQQGESQEQYWNNMELSQQNESVRFVQRLILRLQVAATLNNGVEVNPVRTFPAGFMVQRDDYEWHTAPGRQENPN